MKNLKDYSDEIRIDAMTTLVDALLALEPNKTRKSELAVKILGFDPR